MADTTIGDIATAVSALGLVSGDLLEVEQGGVTKKADVARIKEMVSLKGADVASAATVTLGAGYFFHITGTVTITDIDFTESWDGRAARLIFDGSLTLTHNATTMILPGGVNIVTNAGDSCTVIVESGDNVRITQYERNSAQVSNPGNASTAAQALVAATSTYLTGSAIAIPSSKLKVGSVFRWNLVLTKSAAGTATTQFFVRVGTAGSVADTAVLTFNALPLGTAVTDEAWIEILVTCRGPLSASGIFVGSIYVGHAGNPVGTFTAGFIITTTYFKRLTSATFNVTTAGLIIGISCTSGASVVPTFEQVTAESMNL